MVPFFLLQLNFSIPVWNVLVSQQGLSRWRLPEGETAGDKNWACPFRPFSGASALLSTSFSCFRFAKYLA